MGLHEHIVVLETIDLADFVDTLIEQFRIDVCSKLHARMGR
jgi:hypothetical protein